LLKQLGSRSNPILVPRPHQLDLNTTEDLLASIKTNIQALIVPLTAIDGNTDGLEGFTDGIEALLTTISTLDFATQTTLASVLALLSTIDADTSFLPNMNTQLNTIDNSLDIIEAIDFATQTTLALLATEVTQLLINTNLDQIDANTATAGGNTIAEWLELIEGDTDGLQASLTTGNIATAAILVTLLIQEASLIAINIDVDAVQEVLVKRTRHLYEFSTTYTATVAGSLNLDFKPGLGEDLRIERINQFRGTFDAGGKFWVAFIEDTATGIPILGLANWVGIFLTHLGYVATLDKTVVHSANSLRIDCITSQSIGDVVTVQIHGYLESAGATPTVTVGGTGTFTTSSVIDRVTNLD